MHTFSWILMETLYTYWFWLDKCFPRKTIQIVLEIVVRYTVFQTRTGVYPITMITNPTSLASQTVGFFCDCYPSHPFTHVYCTCTYMYGQM